MTFGEKIKKIRTENDMTQEELAEKLLVTRTAISKWETGSGYPSIDSLQLISKLFDVSIDKLLSDDDLECQKLLEEKRARRFYWIAVLILLLTVAVTTASYFFRLPSLRFLSIGGVAGYVLCALFARPKYRRLEIRKFLVPYVLSRVILLIVIVVVAVTILKMPG